MKILFLSLIYRKQDQTTLLKLSKCGLQEAANQFQWSIIEGLDKNLGRPLQLLNSLPVGTYPRAFRKIVIRSKSWAHSSDIVHDKDIGFFNIFGFKQYFRKIKYVKEIEKWIDANRNEKLSILAYDLYLPYLKAIKTIKRRNPEIEVCAIVTDLPSIYGFIKNDKGIFKILRRSEGKAQLRLAKNIDKFVLLTEKMKFPLNIGKKPYAVIEGMINKNLVNHVQDVGKEKSENKIILYTGTLNSEFGIENLILAFLRIEKPNYFLWLCGTGNMDTKIYEIAKYNGNVKFFGYVSHDFVLSLQRKATVLVNPRTSNGEYTKFSFPSKTLEYLASGTPLIAYKLDGIPDEYDKYIHYVNNDSFEALYEKIIEVCEQSYSIRMDFGKQAKDFIFREKNCYLQTQKIIRLLECNMEYV